VKSQLLLIPLAAVAATAAPACAESYLTIPQAAQILFPGASFTKDFIWLSEAQRVSIQNAARTPQWVNEVKAWRVSSGGWFVVDQVQGRDDMLSYAIGIDGQGGVTGIEILECLEDYSGIRNPAWRRQFVGLGKEEVGDESKFKTISGASLSSSHLIDGVRRDLILYDLILRQRR
jgi:hypothetical protein